MYIDGSDRMMLETATDSVSASRGGHPLARPRKMTSNYLKLFSYFDSVLSDAYTRQQNNQIQFKQANCVLFNR